MDRTSADIVRDWIYAPAIQTKKCRQPVYRIDLILWALMLLCGLAVGYLMGYSNAVLAVYGG